MKKNFFRLMACVLAFAMVLSLAACGSKTSSSSTASTSSSSASSSEASSEAAGGSTSSKFASVAEFLKDPTVSGQLESVMSSMGDDMKIDISGDGDKLVYTFTFNDEVDVEATGAALEEQMSNESFASTFEGIAAMLSDYIEVTNPSVVVTYLAMDGTEIYSQEYFPN